MDKFMPRGMAAEARFSSVAAIRQRFKEAAIPLRRRIVWLATPGPLTRTDLEADLRQALVAASLGELARLDELSDRAQTIQVERRPWWVVVTDLCRGIAWALIPLGLCNLGRPYNCRCSQNPTNKPRRKKPLTSGLRSLFSEG